MQFNYH